MYTASLAVRFCTKKRKFSLFIEKSPEKFWCFGKNPYLCIRFPTKSRIRGFVWVAKQKEFFERIT